jgi:E3 ubiquitin-protein ligase RNF14
MPRKPSKMQDGPRPHVKAAAVAPNPNLAHPAHEYPYDPYDAEVPGAVVDGATDALLRLDVSAATAAEDAPLETPPPPQTKPPAPPQPPLEASSSASAAVGGGWEEEALRRLQELAGIASEKVELTEDEVRANDQRQEDEVMRFLTLFLVSPSLRFGNYSLLDCQA